MTIKRERFNKSDPSCEAFYEDKRWGPWFCTRLPDHEGDHAAFGMYLPEVPEQEDVPFFTWPQGVTGTRNDPRLKSYESDTWRAVEGFLIGMVQSVVEDWDGLDLKTDVGWWITDQGETYAKGLRALLEGRDEEEA